jgi:hypothetical protein
MRSVYLRELVLKDAAATAGLDVTAVTRVVQVQDNVRAILVDGTNWALPPSPVSESAERTLHLSAEGVSANGRRYRMAVSGSTLFASEMTR